MSKRGSNPAPRTGAVARALLEATGISLTDLARGAGVAHQRLSLIEHDREAVSGRQADTLEHILAGRLGMPIGHVRTLLAPKKGGRDAKT
jgi:transcriptional regulator with XRE-family HTH domain